MYAAIYASGRDYCDFTEPGSHPAELNVLGMAEARGTESRFLLLLQCDVAREGPNGILQLPRRPTNAPSSQIEPLSDATGAQRREQRGVTRLTLRA